MKRKVEEKKTEEKYTEDAEAGAQNDAAYDSVDREPERRKAEVQKIKIGQEALELRRGGTSQNAGKEVADPRTALRASGNAGSSAENLSGKVSGRKSGCTGGTSQQTRADPGMDAGQPAGVVLTDKESIMS